MTKIDPPVEFIPPTEIDPMEEAAHYVRRQWFEAFFPARTTCYHCKKQSPFIMVPWDGNAVIAFGDPRKLRRGNVRLRDITREVQMAFAEHGWKFQLRRSFCPICKGMGSV